MSGFSFPPPPPPPPPSAAAPDQQYGQRGGFGNRGFRGRGRGNNRGGFNRGGPYGQNGAFPSRSMNHENQGLSNHGGNGSQPQAPYQNGPATQQQRFQGLDAQAGFKRSHNQAFNPGPVQAGQAKPDSRPRVPAAPAVPGFGFSLPTVAPSSQYPPQPQAHKKLKKHNTFGLTPKGDVHEDSDNDIDEEATFTQSGPDGKLPPGAIQLRSAADVAAWIAERKKRFPTAARIAVRKAEQDATREKAKEKREAKLQSQMGGREKAANSIKREKNRDSKERSASVKRESSAPALQPVIKVEPAPDDPLARIAALEEQLRQAKEALANTTKPEAQKEIKTEPQDDDIDVKLKEDPDAPGTESGTVKTTEDIIIEPRAKIVGTLNLGYGSDDEQDMDSASEISSEDPSSESDIEDSDSDEPPEEESTKSQISAIPQKGPNQPEICFAFRNTGRCKSGNKCLRSHDMVCKFYAKTGNCKYGTNCRLSHDVTPATGGKKRKVMKASVEKHKTMSLRERMIEKELEEEARLGLQVIKQLSENGFFEGT